MTCKPENPLLAKFRKIYSSVLFLVVPRLISRIKILLEGAFSKTDTIDLEAILTGVSAHI